MKSMSFRYIKPSGDVSDRVFIPLVSPCSTYFGIDISELSIEEQTDFELQVKQLDKERAEKIAELMCQFDIRHNYRNFSPERMQDVKFLEME